VNKPPEDLLAWLFEKGSAAKARPRGNTVLLSRIARYKVSPTVTEAKAIAAEAAEHPDPIVQQIAAQLLQEVQP
jgi:hypothetical protein